MSQTNIKITILKDTLRVPLDAQALQNAIFVESGNEHYVLSQITVSGKYDREYTVASYFLPLDEFRVLLDGDLLIFCLFHELVVIDLAKDKLIKSIAFDGYELLRIIKFKSGYFLHGEAENRFLDKHFKTVWEAGAVDIFANSKAEKALEIYDDFITVFDWCGYKHIYDEVGEVGFSTYYPEYNCNEEE